MIRRQLDLFEVECADLIAECDTAERAYDTADRGEAEEKYGDYLDLVKSGTDRLAELRNGFASTMHEDAAEAYEAAFNGGVQARLPRFALGIENA